MSEIKLLSVNCRGLNGNQKRRNVFKYLKEMNCHIACLQDTHFIRSQEKTIYSQWNGGGFFSYGSSNSRGVAILFNKNLEYKVHEKICDDLGNFVILDLTIEGNRLTLATVYGPNTDRPEFYEHVFHDIDNIGNDSVIICGDFNLVLDPKLDYFQFKKVYNKNPRETLLKFITTNHLIDIYREHFSNTKRYTWRKSNPLQQPRLDLF